MDKRQKLTKGAEMKMIKISRSGSKKSWDMPLSEWKKVSKKYDVSDYKAVEFEVLLNKYKYRAWIHPKRGGDDYEMEFVYECAKRETAENRLKKYLAKVSDVTTDYILV